LFFAHVFPPFSLGWHKSVLPSQDKKSADNYKKDSTDTYPELCIFLFTLSEGRSK
jgi:hypothetical protein